MTDIKDIIKKTQKITTAIYMVSDYIDINEPLRLRLRNLSLSLLSDTENIESHIKVQGYKNVFDIKNNIERLASTLEMAEQLKMVSKMNRSILERELKNLAIFLEKVPNFISIESSSISGFTIDDDFFGTPLKDQNPKIQNYPQTRTEKRNPKSISNFGRPNTPIVIKDTKENFLKQLQNRAQNDKTNIERRDERKLKIVDLIKDKGVQEGVMIKDISRVFPELSEKTIQRELVELVENGQLKKMGEKRWSRYYLSK